MPSTDIYAQFPIIGVIILAVLTILTAIGAAALRAWHTFSAWYEKQQAADAEQARLKRESDLRLAEMREKEQAARDELQRKFYEMMQARQSQDMAAVTRTLEALSAIVAESVRQQTAHNEISRSLFANYEQVQVKPQTGQLRQRGGGL